MEKVCTVLIRSVDGLYKTIVFKKQIKKKKLITYKMNK